jgi:hypothetical protein
MSYAVLVLLHLECASHRIASNSQERVYTTNKTTVLFVCMLYLYVLIFILSVEMLDNWESDIHEVALGVSNNNL